MLSYSKYSVHVTTEKISPAEIYQIEKKAYYNAITKGQKLFFPIKFQYAFGIVSLGIFPKN